MEQIKISEVEKIAAKHDYKHAGLYDAAGVCVVALNTAKIPLKQKISQIKKRIGGLTDGYYTLRFQHTLGKKYTAYDYLIKVGTVSEAPPVNAPRIQGNTDQVRGWEEALSDKQKIAELESENRRLKAIEDSLSEEEEEQENEEEEKGKKTLAENIVEASKDILPQFLPVFDKLFEYKNRELSLREKELEWKRNPVPAPVQLNQNNLRAVHPYRPVPTVAEAQKYNEYCAWLQSLNDNDFNVEMNSLETVNPETFEAVKKAFNITVQQNSAANE